MTFQMDIEQADTPDVRDDKGEVKSLSWCIKSVKQAKSGPNQLILKDIEGIVDAGELCAIMGPSGSGKTTLLNALANRPTRNQVVNGSILVNGTAITRSEFDQISCFVEHEEALIGGLTVFETLWFSSQLGNKSTRSKTERVNEINKILQSFGLTRQENTVISTAFRKGLSSGQKRRLAIAKQLITSPQILFLDEPTSGLDSAGAFQVIQYLKETARRNNAIIICSMHQPSTSILALFDRLALISRGQPQFFGDTSTICQYLETSGIHLPTDGNPADCLLELVNTDFAPDESSAMRRVEDLQVRWRNSHSLENLHNSILRARERAIPLSTGPDMRPRYHKRLGILLHRNFIKSYRDPLVYGIRLAFVITFAILIGTVWWRLDRDQESIERLISEIYFAPCFMSLSSFIYAPAFIEDYLHYRHDQRHGLYDSTEFIICNFLIGVPFLFFLSLVFSLIAYWLSHLVVSAAAFFLWVWWIFATTLAAESLVVLAASVFPNFMFTIAFTSLFNSILLCTQGFLVSLEDLNPFYKYGFYYWNYLSYVFEGLMMTQFSDISYSCGRNCDCLYNSTKNCEIPGESVLRKYSISDSERLGRNVCIVFAIILGFRVMTWVILRLGR